MRAIVVDAYGSSRYLPPELATFNMEAVHLQSSPAVPGFFKTGYMPELFDHTICFDGEFASLVEKARTLDISTVIAGIEKGVFLADRLAAALGVPGNDPAGSTIRRNKFTMIEAVRRAGLHCADQRVFDPANLLSDDEVAYLGWPVVAKPLSSAGSDNVFICHGIEAFRAAQTAILQSRDIIDEAINPQGLVQTYLSGPQFVVNTVSIGGVHGIAEIWLHSVEPSPSGGEIIEHKTSVPSHMPYVETLIQYTKNILDALGVREGAGHAEIRMTTDGFALVELGARLMGGPLERVPHIATFGCSHATMLAARYGAPGLFLSSASTRYKTRSNMALVNLRAPQSGKLVSLPGMEVISNLPSFHMAVGVAPIDGFITQTSTNASSGSVYLVHDDAEVLKGDLEQISELKQAGKVFTFGEPS